MSTRGLPMSSRRYTGPSPETVNRVLLRDGWRCVRSGEDIGGTRGLDYVIHHRRPRGLGGSRRADTNDCANLLTLCTPCHVHVESHRGEALSNGWLVPQGTDPATVGCLVEHGSRFVYLSADGSYSESPPERDAA